MPGGLAPVDVEDLGEEVVVHRGAGLGGLLLHVRHGGGQEHGVVVRGEGRVGAGEGLAEGRQNLLPALFAEVGLHRGLPLLLGQGLPVSLGPEGGELRDDAAHHGGLLQGGGAEVSLQGVAGVVGVGLRGPAHPLALGLQGLYRPVDSPDELGRRHLFQLLHFLLPKAQLGEDLQHQLPAGALAVKLPGGDDAGHDDHLLEQVLRLGDLPQDGDLPSAAGLAEDGDVPRVAAEVRDVLLHPAQSRHQVGHAHVDAVPVLLPKVRQVQVAEGV